MTELLFSELEQDLLAEMFNVGVGQAAASLSKMVKQEVLLSVPRVEFVSHENLSIYIDQKKKIAGVSQFLEGNFCADSILIFPEEHSLEIIGLMLGEEISREMLTELQPEAFAEIGNIVLNACIGAIAQMFQITFHVTLPKFQVGTFADIVDRSHHDHRLLLVKIDMTLRNNDVTGFLAFVLGSDSMEQLQLELKKLLGTL